MKNTYIIVKYDKRIPVSLENLKKSFKSINNENTGFVNTECEITFECEENKHYFESNNCCYDFDKTAQQEENFNSVTVVVTHNDSFINIVSDEFIKDFHYAISLLPSKKVVRNDYDIDIMLSACK